MASAPVTFDARQWRKQVRIAQGVTDASGAAPLRTRRGMIPIGHVQMRRALTVVLWQSRREPRTAGAPRLGWVRPRDRPSGSGSAFEVVPARVRAEVRGGHSPAA